MNGESYALYTSWCYFLRDPSFPESRGIQIIYFLIIEFLLL